MIPELADCLDRSLTFLREQVEDLSEEEMILQPQGVTNHAAWTLGHVIYSCHAIAGELGMKPWLPEDWEGSFAYGSIPCRGLSPYTKPVLLAMLNEAGRRLRAALTGMDPRTLGDSLPDAAAREMFPTLGQALLQVVAAHTAFHAGQLAAWRRAIGHTPRGVFL